MSLQNHSQPDLPSTFANFPRQPGRLATTSAWQFLVDAAAPMTLSIGMSCKQLRRCPAQVGVCLIVYSPKPLVSNLVLQSSLVKKLRLHTAIKQHGQAQESTVRKASACTSCAKLIIRCLSSPGSSKDDEVLYGDAETRTREGAATTDAPAGHAVPHTVSPDAQLQTDKGQKDHSILRQILNPHGEKYDAEGYGSTAHVVGQGSDITGSNTGAGIGSSAAQSLPDRTAQT